MKKTIRCFTVILLSLLVFTANPARAMIDVPTLRLAFGVSPLSFCGGTIYPCSPINNTPANVQPLGEKFTLNPMFLWDIPSFRSRIGIHYIADLGSQFGYNTISGIGATFIFYPLGLSSGREVRDDFTEVVKSRVSPFIEFQLTPTTMAITKPTATSSSSSPSSPSNSQSQYFDEGMMEFAFGAGVDYPMSGNLVLFLDIQYRYANDPTGETAGGPVKYSGLGILLGVMTNFY